MNNSLKKISDFGQSVWFDGITSNDHFKRLIKEDGISGATTNPTIFEKAIESGIYEDQIKNNLNFSEEEIYQSILVKAAQEAADVFLPVYNRTSGENGFVSIEVNPHLAHNVKGSIDEAKELHRRIGRKNIMIKVPATEEGICVIKELLSFGINVNATLVFSIDRYKSVAEAYLLAIEDREKKDEDISQIVSVASFFVSRIDTVCDSLFEKKIENANEEERLTLQNFLGKSAIANAKTAYSVFEDNFLSQRFFKLKKKNARVQRVLWASTATKNKNYSDVLYVESLMGRNTVTTLSENTLSAFRHHGLAGSFLHEKKTGDVSSEDLKRMGVDLSKVTEDLETAGVQAFIDSYSKILETISRKKAMIKENV